MRQLDTPLHLLEHITNLQSVLITTNFSTDQPALIATLHQTAQAKSPESLISLELIAPEKNSLSIANVREIQEQLRYAATKQRPRWIALLHADTLTIPAQNALLKTLEEPPAHTVLLLSTSHPGRLLPTVTSRTMILGEKQISEILQVPLPKLSTATEPLASYSELRAASIAQACQRAEEFGDKESAITATQQLLSEIHHTMQRSHETDQNPQQLEKQIEDAQSCVNALQQLEANCNVKLAMGELLLSFN